MKFEDTLKKISAILATVVMMILAGSIYLMAKGFRVDENNNFVLVREANAAVAESSRKTSSQTDESSNEVSITSVTNSGTKMLGNPNAPVTIYEYSSFGCTHCADFHIYTLPKIEEDFIRTGKANLVFVDFPLDKTSMKGSLLSHCMKSEKEYFEFLTILFKSQRDLMLTLNADKKLIQYASLFGLDKKEAKACMENKTKQDEILSARGEAMNAYKIEGTPTFVLKIGKKTKVLHGAPSYENLAEIINEANSK